MSDYPQSFQACRLFRKASQAGNTYFTGRWGGARVALLKSNETADDGGEIWNLMLAEAPARSTSGPWPKPPNGSPTRRRHKGSSPLSRALIGRRHREPKSRSERPAGA
jgi:hypothetical protein